MINGQVYVTEEIPTDKEKFDFLFVDMEWNQKAGTSDLADREPIQIGLIGTDANLEKRKLFSKSIRLDDASTLTEETCKLTHIIMVRITGVSSPPPNSARTPAPKNNPPTVATPAPKFEIPPPPLPE